MNFKIDLKNLKNFVIAEIGTNHNRSKKKSYINDKSSCKNKM